MTRRQIQNHSLEEESGLELQLCWAKMGQVTF